MSHTVHTIRLHRVLKAPPQRVYQAFTTAAALAKWLPPHGYICEVPEFDARVGGRYRMAFVNLSTGGRSGFGGEVLDLEPLRSEEHTAELQSQSKLVFRLLLEKKKKISTVASYSH